MGIAYHAASNTFLVADFYNNRLRVVNASDGSTTTRAGEGRAQSLDGVGDAAYLNGPHGVCVDPASGAAFFTEYYSQSMRVAAPDGTTSTLAGGQVASYFQDGSPGANVGMLFPAGCFYNASGASIVFSDSGNNVIRRMSAADGGTVTIAGMPGAAGSADGPGLSAGFRSPTSVALHASTGTIYIADRGNNCLRALLANGTVTRVAGICGLAGGFANRTLGSSVPAQFSSPWGVATDGVETLFVIDTGNHAVRRVDLVTGSVTTIAGLGGTSGFADGAGTTARFFGPTGVAMNGAGMLAVADTNNQAIRLVSSVGFVSTLVGQQWQGYRDGPPSASLLSRPAGLALDAAGGVVFADYDTNRIRGIRANDSVTYTIAGSGSPGVADSANPLTATFYSPRGVCVDAATGAITTVDSGNRRMRRIFPNGTVITLAGNGISGTTDGNSSIATFTYPWACVIDGTTGITYVTDDGGNKIRAVTTSGVVTTVAGNGTAGFADGVGTAALLRAPMGLALHKGARKLVFGDTGNYRIRTFDLSTGLVVTLAGSGAAGVIDGTATTATFMYIAGVAVDEAGGYAYVADYLSNSIRRVDLTTGDVVTVIGASVRGFNNKAGVQALFAFLTGIAFDPASGALYVSDSDNAMIRKLTFS